MGATTTIEEAIASSKCSQNKTELKYLLSEVSTIEPKVILEIGTWRGYSAELFMQVFNPELLVTIENDREAVDFLQKRMTDGELRYLLPNCINLVEGNSNDETTLDIVRHLLGGRNVDFLFIDGDHHYEAVKRDLDLYGPLVRSGGIIAFHDIALRDHPEVEVYKLWDEIESQFTKNCTSVWAQDKGTGGTGTGVLYVK